MDPQQTLPSDDTSFIPTTDKIPKFRILVIGRSGTGKSSLINAIFKVDSIADVRHNEAGSADINTEITSVHNKHLILHDSQGYEPGDNKNFEVLKDFILERGQKRHIDDRLHAIWLCIAVPHAGGRLLETGDENVFQLFQLKRNKVPIILVFTKFDLMATEAAISLVKEGVPEDQIPQKRDEIAERNFKNEYNKSLRTKSRNIIDKRYVLVSTFRPDTLKQLVNITMKSIQVDISGPSTKNRFKNFFTKNAENLQSSITEEDLSDSAQITLATAQRIDTKTKIIASIKVGKKKYWVAIAYGALFSGRSLLSCLNVIHKDIITIWNVRGLDPFLSSDAFRAQMTEMVSDLSDKKRDPNTGQFRAAITTAAGVAGVASGIAASAAAGPAAAIVAPLVAAALLAAWGYNVYNNTPGIICCLMGYVVDLTVILQAVFQVSLQDKDGEVADDRVQDIVNKFNQSKQKKEIHDEIKGFVDSEYPFKKASAVEKIEYLIENRKFSVE